MPINKVIVSKVTGILVQNGLVRRWFGTGATWLCYTIGKSTSGVTEMFLVTVPGMQLTIVSLQIKLLITVVCLVYNMQDNCEKCPAQFDLQARD